MGDMSTRAREDAGRVAEELPPEELVRRTGRLVPELAELAPRGAPHGRQPARQRRPAAARSAPAGFPRLRREVPRRARDAEATRVQGEFIRDVMKAEPRQLPRVQPGRDRLEPLGRVFEVTNRCSTAEIRATTTSPDGRVMEMLSEHQCEGWLEGYLLTGRHGFFSCYEAFIHIIDSMFNQHAKWLKVCEPHSLAPADCLAELPAHVARLAAGPQRLQPSGPRLHRPRREQEAESSASTCRPTPTRCSR
jgi:xylulose-5-phosphate/fructose-6-phosphate phosphoketolase